MDNPRLESRHPRLRAAAAIALAIASSVFACEAPPSTQTTSDASSPPVDATASDGADAHDGAEAHDGAVDATVDATVDSAPDATVDSALDATADNDAGSIIEAGIDAPLEGGADADAGSVDCVTSVLGPAGGALLHRTGARIVVPVGALASPTPLSLCADPVSLVPGAIAVGPAFQAGPEGQTFLSPVEVIIPFDATRLSPGASLDTIQMHMAPQGASTFGALQSTVDLAAGLVHAFTTHFTQFVPAQVTAPLFITTSPSLPAATALVSFSQQFAASGGTPPYQWTVPPATPLPPGLLLSSGGLLSGAPTIPSNYAFFIAVSDAVGDAIEMAVSLTVNAPSNPIPALAQVNPSSTLQGSGDLVIRLSGSSFVPGAQVLWDGAPLPTTFVSATSLAASVPASDLVSVGSHDVSVSNPPPGGGTSGSVTFSVTPAVVNPVPSILSASPTQLPVSSINVQIAITGSSFISSSSATIGAQGVTTSYVSPTQLVAAIPAAYLSNAGTLQIGVFTPPPGGGFSPTTVSITVGTLNPAPTLTALTPASVNAGSGAFTLGLSGTNFVQGAQVFFGGTALATTFTSTTSLTAAVPAYLVANLCNAQVLVVNPAPGGGASVPLPFQCTQACNVPCSAIPPSTAQCTNGGNTCLVTLASGQNDPWGITVDSTNVYWAGYAAGTVMQIATGGGTAIAIATGQDYPVGIAVDSTSVYWTNRNLSTSAGAVRKVPIGGGTIVELAKTFPQPNNIAVDSTSVYFTTNSYTQNGVAVDGGGLVAKMPLDGPPDGGAPVTLATAETPFALAVESTGAYFATVGSPSSNIGGVIAVGLDGGSPSPIATGQVDPWGIAVDSTHVYWTANTVVMSAAHDGGAPMALGSATGAAGITVDSNDVYWADNAAGKVMKVSIHGGTPTPLAGGQTYPRSIAVDATSVYWTNEGGTVMKLTPK
jgi:hypothetical protein